MRSAELEGSVAPWGGRSPSRARIVALLLLAALVAGPGAVRAESDPPDPDSSTAESPADARRSNLLVPALEERVRLLSDLLLDASRSYRKLAIERGSVQQEFGDALERLDREAVRSRDLTRERLEALHSDVLRAKLRLDQLVSEMTRRLDDMRGLIIERDALVRRIGDLKGKTSTAPEPLTGTWEVTWMPNGVSGTFYLDQSGTLVTGQYKLGPLGQGSVQGTFVAGKLYLQRIDSQRGRDAEIEGVLEPDGKIRGTWQAFELSQGGLPRGQWTARRAK